MIVWGWKTVFRVIGSGVFACPNCGTDRNYERRRAQRFFTLFFIPLIPLKTLGEFIRCTHCKNDFRDSVLALPTAAQFSDLLQNTVRGVMVNVLRRGGTGHPGARAIAVEEIVSGGSAGYNDGNLSQDLQVVPDDLTHLLAQLAGQLPDTGREALVRGAVRVAAADGPVSAAERGVIDAVGAALGMTQAHVAGVVASVPAPQPGATGGYAAQPATGFQQPPTGFEPPADHNATWVDNSSSMETMLIPPKPAQPPVAEASSMETMMLPPKRPEPAADSTASVPAPSAAPTAANDFTDLQSQPPADAPTGPVTLSVPATPLPAPAPPVAAPVAPESEASGRSPAPESDASAMETMIVPIAQVPPRPRDSAEEPTHVTQQTETWRPNQ